MNEQDIRDAVGSISAVLMEMAREDRDQEAVELLVGGIAGIVSQLLVDINRIANAVERPQQGTPGPQG